MIEATGARSGPLFVHASPRGGSTFFFHALRRANSLICFNEVLNDGLAGTSKRALARRKQKIGWDFNHDFLEENDRAEIIQAWNWFGAVYPALPAFRDFFPHEGKLPGYLRVYLDSFINYADAVSKRPAFCEVYSRGRAGALRAAYGGYHIAQVRDPISQFGSLFRAVEERGLWPYLSYPVMELGANGTATLCALIPPAWALPSYPWPGRTPTETWLSFNNYKLLVASPRPSALELAFRTHILSWMLTNLAAICFSDLLLDIDKLHDDPTYRAGTVAALKSEVGIAPDFSRLTKFTRHLRFEAFDMEAVCHAVMQFVTGALDDGRLEAAVSALSPEGQRVSTRVAVELLSDKLERALESMGATVQRHVSNKEWVEIASMHRVIWQNDRWKKTAAFLYPVGAPVVHWIRRLRGAV